MGSRSWEFCTPFDLYLGASTPNATTIYMDQKRAQTLEALEAFIRGQKTLLEAAHSDIERLRGARTAAIADPSVFLDNLTENLESLGLNALPNFQVVIPKGIDWSVFEGHDPAPLQKHTLDAQRSFAERNEPHSTQKSPLSDLQKLVKSARLSIIDPMLIAFSQYMADFGENEESEDEMDEEELRREREREKIRLLKQRKIRTCGLKLPGLRMEGGSTAVFVRHDIEDESMDVDISDQLSDENENHTSFLVQHSAQQNSNSNTHHKPSRTRRPTIKKSHASLGLPSISRPRKKSRIDAPPNSKAPPPPPPSKSSASPPSDKKDKAQSTTGKPKPETYKQAWSISEQHLLEQLLEQIPDGEKYRWQKISRAMNGRRTPRQVASRVQKYFEKLKKYGIDAS